MRTTRRDQVLQVRLSATERARVFEAAQRAERTVSELVRDAIRATLASEPSAHTAMEQRA